MVTKDNLCSDSVKSCPSSTFVLQVLQASKDITKKCYGQSQDCNFNSNILIIFNSNQNLNSNRPTIQSRSQLLNSQNALIFLIKSCRFVFCAVFFARFRSSHFLAP